MRGGKIGARGLIRACRRLFSYVELQSVLNERRYPQYTNDIAGMNHHDAFVGPLAWRTGAGAQLGKLGVETTSCLAMKRMSTVSSVASSARSILPTPGGARQPASSRCAPLDMRPNCAVGFVDPAVLSDQSDHVVECHPPFH